MAHPPGAIRLGVVRHSRKPVDLTEDELSLHIFLPGVTGMGKTTTVKRLCDGALHLGWAVIVVDCKGGSLVDTSRAVAEQYGVPFRLIDPDDERSLGYNPCTGDANAITNKLLGAFAYGPEAEVYKHAASEILPVIIRILQAAGEPVTLSSIAAAFEPGQLANLRRQAKARTTAGAVEPHIEQAKRLLSRGGSLGKSAYEGLQYRFGALEQGAFGDLMRRTPALDWDEALAAPSVTHLSLSALGSSEDVELLGRVIIQDLKQVCAQRLARRDGVIPVLTVLEEFTALREPEQIVALAVQSREARMILTFATQFLPEDRPIRQACLGTGLLISHRLTAEDAEMMAAEFGTQASIEVSRQMDVGGFTGRGSMHPGDKFVVHPNELRQLGQGEVAIRSTLGDRNGPRRLLAKVFMRP